jgi:signal transduction histidine kinase
VPLQPRTARATVVAIVVALCVIAEWFVLRAGGSLVWPLLAAVLLTAYVALLLRSTRPGAPPRRPRLMLAALAVFAFAPIPLFGQAWVGMPMLFGGVALLLLPTRVGCAAAIVVVGIATASQWTIDPGPLLVHEVALSSAVGIVEIYGVARLAHLVTELAAARDELSALAVAQERARFARDLDELLVLSLATIRARTCALRATVHAAPESVVVAELRGVLATARRALGDLRAAARGYRAEFTDAGSLQELLPASRVQVRVDVDQASLSPATRSVLADALRAAVAGALEDNGTSAIDLRRGDGVVLLEVRGESASGAARLPDAFRALAGRAEVLGGGIAVTGSGSRWATRLSLPMDLAAPRQAGSSGAEVLDEVPRRTARFAAALVYGLLVAFALINSTMLVVAGQTGVELGVALVCVIVVVTGQMVLVERFDRVRGRWAAWAVLAGQVLVLHVPVLLFGFRIGFSGFIAGTCLLVLAPRLRWWAFAVVVVGDVLVRVGIGTEAWLLVQGAANTIIVGLVVASLTAMVRAVRELSVARFELARAAVTAERMRFARDLHDLIGLSLSAVTLKAELALRLSDSSREAVDRELAEIHEAIGVALADMQLVTEGVRDLSLDEESRSAAALLRAANVDVRMELSYGELPVEARTVLATVLREGVTNVLRHGARGRCAIRVAERDQTVSLEIVNDSPPGPVGKGSGLRNLADRVEAIGGELTAGPPSPGEFRLAVVVPVPGSPVQTVEPRDGGVLVPGPPA